MKKEIQIGVGDSVSTANGFIDAWRSAQRNEQREVQQRLYFEDLETLLVTLTSGRWALLKELRITGPVSVRALSNRLGRDYKNVYTDVKKLELIGLISRTREDKVEVPWDIVEARLRLAA